MAAQSVGRGYFGVGIYRAKRAENVGTLWRSAYQLGAAYIFTIGQRYQRQASDTTATYRHVPLFRYASFKEFRAGLPHGCMLIAVETGGSDLVTFTHPKRCCYLLGAEDSGLSGEILEQCQAVVSVPFVRMHSYNVAVAGSLVMYDRWVKAK